MSIVPVALLALIAGTHAATWGALKDTPFEGFRVVSFARSIVLAVVIAVLLATGTDLETTTSPVVLVGVLYAMERLATELWKSFIREDDQSAYAIPMRIAVRGRPIDDRFSRYLTGLGVLGGLVLSLVVLTVFGAGVATLVSRRPAVPRTVVWRRVETGAVRS